MQMPTLWCTVLIALSLGSVQARDIVKRDVHRLCPSNSRGEYPNCVCDSGTEFNEVHSICPGQPLESLAGSCPDDSSGEII